MPALIRAPTRDYQTAVMDAHRWDAFKPRDSDIVVATYPKCGTTWTQRIVDMLVHQSSEPRQFLDASPWLDATFFAPIEANLATLEAQTHRRCVKTHMPFDAVPVFEGVKYIHVAREGRDACLSMHNHQLGFLPERMREIAMQAQRDPRIVNTRRETPQDPRAFFVEWMDRAEAYAGDPFGVDMPYCEFEQTYWRERMRPNLLHVHYADLKADLAGEMRRISDFLGIATPDALLPELVQAATFETMKRQGDAIMARMRGGFDRGADRFLDKGIVGRWKGVLTDDDLARFEALVKARLSESHAAWLANGRLAAGDPRELPD